MIVIRRYMHNALRNFNYLIACPETREAIALDPLDAKAMFAAACEHDLTIVRIINTHEHHDHVEGNLELQELTGASIWAHVNALGKIPGQTHSIKAGDVIQVGSITLTALFTPGHTPVHLCLLSAPNEVGQQALFSGDTLFNACAGNCKNGGNVDSMYETFVSQLMPLPNNTLLYPGHDYMKNNLAFALDREPENGRASFWQEEVSAFDPDDMPVMTLGQEREYNPFLRLHELSVRARLLEQFPDMEIGERAVFKALRHLRDSW